MYCSIAPLTNTLVIVGKFLSCSVDAGFVLALPLHHGGLELDSVGVAILVARPWLRGAYLQDKTTCARTLTENVGVGLYAKGGLYAGHYSIHSSYSVTCTLLCFIHICTFHDPYHGLIPTFVLEH